MYSFLIIDVLHVYNKNMGNAELEWGIWRFKVNT